VAPFVGLDPATHAVWAVRLRNADGPAEVADTALMDPAGEASVLFFCDGVTVVAVDAPDGPSEGRHLDDETLPPKFRQARCAEVAPRSQGISVPWTTRVANPDPWMVTGFRLWQLLRYHQHRVVETFPYAVYHRLIGARPARKGTPQGLRQRLDALHPFVTPPPFVQAWGHDGVDALAAVCVAAACARGAGVEVRCRPSDPGQHDSSRISLLPSKPWS